MIILIPAFEPGESLVAIVRELRNAQPFAVVVIVDDGSGPLYGPLFAAAESEGADVIGYSANRGKGHALKTGFRHVIDTYPGEAVVTADSDGQHRVRDIVRVAERTSDSSDAVVLGGRQFTGDVPLRSRVGNSVSRAAFQLATGHRVGDTQTGLRGFPASALDWLLEVPGDRFDYETRMLLAAGAAGYRLDEIPIETVYLEHNASSHFRPVVDSVRVIRPLLTFGAVSLGSFLVDLLVLELVFVFTSSLVLSVIGARVVSGSLNFLANRRAVFRAGEYGIRVQALRYLTLALALLAVSFGSITALTQSGVPLLAAKVTTDVALYVVSYLVQRRFVFSKQHAPAKPVAGRPGDSAADDRARRILA